MSTSKLRQMRLNYKAAYTEYMHCVHVLSISSLKGEWLTPTEIAADEKAFNALSLARRVLLNELREHAERAGTEQAKDGTRPASLLP